MNLLLLLFTVIFFIEILIFFKYTFYFKLMIKLMKSSSLIIFKENISDHWKEKIIPIYSLKIMKYSFLSLLAPVFLSFIFFMINFFNDGFITFVFSLRSIFLSILMGFIYLYLRKNINNE